MTTYIKQKLVITHIFQREPMKTVLIALLLLLVGCSGVRTKTELNRNAPSSFQSHTERVCLLAGFLPSEYKFVDIGRIKATKGTYGSVDEITIAIAKEARRLGADAVVGLQANQKFKGPLPWRVTSPTGDGMAIKVTPESPKLDCMLAGGRVG